MHPAEAEELEWRVEQLRLDSSPDPEADIPEFPSRPDPQP